MLNLKKARYFPLFFVDLRKYKPLFIMEEKKKNKNAAIGCLSFVAIIAVIAFLIWALFYPKGDKALSIDAYLTATTHIKKQLKSPATAEFPVYNEDFVTITGKDSVTVISYVDSQNGFGAIIRSNFIVKMHKKGDDWYCDYFTIQ
jgi:hypothetical protein